MVLFKLPIYVEILALTPLLYKVNFLLAFVAKSDKNVLNKVIIDVRLI